jgi:hypothetical protein
MVRCSLCGEVGHNCRTCGNTRPLPVRGVRKCGCCGEVGHNKRTCPKKKEDQLKVAAEAVVEWMLACEADEVEQKFQAELALLLADEADEEPLPQDLELTPTPRSEIEVDVATEGYREICGLNHDLMLMVGEQVGEIRVKINLEWWEGKIHFTSWDDMTKSRFRIFRSRSAMGVIGQEPTLLSVFEVDRSFESGWAQQDICRSIRNATDLLEARNKTLKPSTLKLKYILREIGFPEPLWKRTKAQFALERLEWERGFRER